MKKMYGQERNLGDIILNKDNNSVFVNIEGGIFGRLTLNILKDKEYGGYILQKSYTAKDGTLGSFIAGRTFPVKNKNGDLAEGITQGVLGLLREYDKESGRNLISDKDGLQIVTHKLKEHKRLGETNLFKVGYLTGRFVIEEPKNESAAEDFIQSQDEISDEDIPF
ncbi:hypothetical protein [Helicobacter equorum]|uniref:Uncharacterized protein n=1 Tax=Helicobacter equorum TaxID=361872 RepID=A0A3D8IPF4_9HELI|nr:hypothetical protein [Helicobacter equorum]RDU66491.1 hypothetical protein CQA54_07260 [Helicobacter equorum]